ncbi:hypothetical protein ANFP_13530 [Acidithiobacillus ferrooxidans]|nr:hypothetical protein ANFP_13530 [Acidithiobacillus ferrooxidans]
MAALLMGAAQLVGINPQEAVGQKTCVFTSMGTVMPEICLENALAGTFIARERPGSIKMTYACI